MLHDFWNKVESVLFKSEIDVNSLEYILHICNTLCNLILFSKNIKSLLQDYQVDLYLRQQWFDPRLNHSEIKQVSCADPIFTLKSERKISSQVLDLNDPKLVQAIWKPEVQCSDIQTVPLLSVLPVLLS